MKSQINFFRFHETSQSHASKRLRFIRIYTINLFVFSLLLCIVAVGAQGYFRYVYTQEASAIQDLQTNLTHTQDHTVNVRHILGRLEFIDNVIASDDIQYVQYFTIIQNIVKQAHADAVLDKYDAQKSTVQTDIACPHIECAKAVFRVLENRIVTKPFAKVQYTPDSFRVDETRLIIQAQFTLPSNYASK